MVEVSLLNTLRELFSFSKDFNDCFKKWYCLSTDSYNVAISLMKNQQNFLTYVSLQTQLNTLAHQHILAFETKSFMPTPPGRLAIGQS